MKSILLLLVLALIITACNDSKEKPAVIKNVETKQPSDPLKMLKDSANFTTVQWLDSTYKDFGKVEEGQIVDIAFRLKNTGDKPLFIANVSVGCGCTTILKKPEEPLEPGQEDVIKAKFDSKNMAGERLKEVHVIANTKNNTSHTLWFRVEVVKK
jgi:hypothetical protein